MVMMHGKGYTGTWILIESVKDLFAFFLQNDMLSGKSNDKHLCYSLLYFPIFFFGIAKIILLWKVVRVLSRIIRFE